MRCNPPSPLMQSTLLLQATTRTYLRPSLSSISKHTPLISSKLPPLRSYTMASATSFYDFEPLDSTPPHLLTLPHIHPPSRARAPANPPTEKGQPYPLSTLKNKVVLIVNTASKCGFTPQFEGLETLYKKIKEKYPDDFIILGFPCNQFMNQDPVRSPFPHLHPHPQYPSKHPHQRATTTPSNPSAKSTSASPSPSSQNSTSTAPRPPRSSNT